MQNSDWGDLAPEAVTKIKVAVRDGVREALADPTTADQFVAGMYEAFSRHATDTVGRTAIGAIKTLIVRGLLFALIGALVYSVGGWAALVGFWKLLVAKGS